MPWTEIIDRFGVAVAVLIAFMSAGWAILRWLAPRVDKLFNKHMDFVEKVSDNITSQTETLNGLLSRSDRHSEALEKIEDKLDGACKFTHGRRPPG